MGPDFLPTGRTEPLLFAELPELRGRVPWMPLAHVPTPVEPARAIEPWLGRGGVWVKRDDLVSPLYGGNKVRKYENVLADAREKGAKTLVTVGGLASTQVTATTLFGRALGFEVLAVLFDQPMTAFGRRALLGNAAAGATLVRGGGYVTTAWRAWRAWRRTSSGYFIPPGAADPQANLGYVDAMLELGEQVRKGEMPRPDAIVLATGSSGTLAALALGAAYLGWDTTVIGVRITSILACNRISIGFILGSTARWLERISPRFARARAKGVRWRLFHRAIGKGYGWPTREAIAGVARVKDLTGVPGEVTYTGKALAGLEVIAKAPEWRDKTILYWHTLSGTFPEAPEEARQLLPRSFDDCFEGDLEV